MKSLKQYLYPSPSGIPKETDTFIQREILMNFTNSGWPHLIRKRTVDILRFIGYISETEIILTI